MTSIFHTIISEPLYSGLVFLINLLPFFDVGVVIIIFTIITKLVLLPLSIKASRSQLEMKSAEKDLALIKEKYKDKNEQGVKIMEYYKEKGMNPFTGIFIILIQIPILIGLYRVFIGLPEINTSLLYSFISIPPSVDMMFLGLINMAEKSLILALLVGITTYFQTSIATSGQTESQDKSKQSEMAKAMSFQMKYFLPPFITIIIYNISSAVALYLFVSNLFSIVQELYIKRKYHKSIAVV
ncbi:MAG: preprotein translocase subunit YidC [Parcubacteria group bacterium Gr01-1014_46]|nr:MAG: preprotein translocase subunit YidC [Parcubacteria group bacterium Gr01-1014_46]